jgi:hypothetical protein
MHHLPAQPHLERRDLRLRRLRDAIATRYGVPPSALASLDPSTVATIATRVQEKRVLRVRIEQVRERPDDTSETMRAAAHPSMSRATVED